MSKNQETSQKQNKKNLLQAVRGNSATIGAIAVAALTGLTQPASARGNTAASGGTSAEIAPAPTKAEQALNTKAQNSVDRLAASIIRIGADHPGSKHVSHALDAQGDELALTTITIPATSQYGSNNGVYEFSVLAPVSKAKKVQSLSISEGVKDAPEPYTTLTFNTNPVTEGWEVGGVYGSFKGETVSIVAGVNSLEASMPKLTGGQLEAAVRQAESITEHAAKGAPVNYEQPAFSQTLPSGAEVTVSPTINGGTPGPDSSSQTGGTPSL